MFCWKSWRLSYSFGDDEDFEVQDNIVTSIKIGSVLWSAVVTTNFNSSLDIVKEANEIWVQIIDKVRVILIKKFFRLN